MEHVEELETIGEYHPMERVRAHAQCLLETLRRHGSEEVRKSLEARLEKKARKSFLSPTPVGVIPR